MFDDSYPSHWQVAVPELVKRGRVATFYLNPGKAEFQKFKEHWGKELWQQGMVYGDHTMTHKGVKDFENADWEIGQCARLPPPDGPGPGPAPTASSSSMPSPVSPRGRGTSPRAS